MKMKPQASSTVSSSPAFTSLPPEVRIQIWRHALPAPRSFNVLIWNRKGLHMRLLSREGLDMPLAHACYESRQVVQDEGYSLAFADVDREGDTGVWYHPGRDILERTIWDLYMHRLMSI